MKTITANLKNHTKFDIDAPSNTQVGAIGPFDDGVDLSIRHLYLELARVDATIGARVVEWQEAGQELNDTWRGLIVTDEEVGKLLSMPFRGRWEEMTAGTDSPAPVQLDQQLVDEFDKLYRLSMQENQPLRFQLLVDAFGLNDFERDALLICLAPALDLRYEPIFSYLQNDVNRKRPTTNLIIELLSESGTDRLQRLTLFHADAPLMRYGLLQPVDEPGGVKPNLLGQGMRVDQSVVAWLLGRHQPPGYMEMYTRLEYPTPDRENSMLTVPVHVALNAATSVVAPILLFHGPDQASQLAASRLLAAKLHKPLYYVDFRALLAQNHDAHQVVRHCLRDARLNYAVVCFQGWDACLQEQAIPEHLLREIYDHFDTIILAGKQFWQPSGLERQRHLLSVEFALPDYGQRKMLWQHYIDRVVQAGAVPEANVDSVELAGQFTLSTDQIRDAVASARDMALQRGADNGSVELTQRDLFAGARVHSGLHLADLARKIEPRYDWDDIILPPDQMEILRELVATVRGRSTVLEEWGLGKKLASSAAVTVLFAGPPGTGKTMAAEVIARDLGLDLYKIDLSSLVSKYIGETEKNLERIFSAAQTSNAILFFDEADAIFGKRSGVKDARDRYANIEVSYLLQRMEIYDGVTILATNLRSNLDEAFLRRIQFAVDIPFPDEKDRLRIWETLFPDTVPRDPDVDLAEMASRFKLPGGNIRNVIVSAAYLAAQDGGVITMQHLLHGTRREFQKMGRLVPDLQGG